MSESSEEHRPDALRGPGSILNRINGSIRGLPRNERVLFLEMGFQSIVVVTGFTYLNVYLTRLGASSWLITAFSSLPALVTIIFAIPVGMLVQGSTNMVRTANWGRFLYRIFIGLFAFLPLFSPQVAAVILVTAHAVMAIPGLVGNISVTSILGQVTTPERRPRMLSIRLAINGLVASLAALVAGRWLNNAPYPLNYQVLFIAGLAAGCMSILIFSKLRIEQKPAQDIGKQRLSVQQLINTLRDAPVFRRWSVIALLFRIAIAMPQALYIIYKVRVLGSSDAWIGVLLLVENALSVLVYLFLGRFCSRPGFNKWLLFSLLGTVLYPITTALARNPVMLLVPAICSAVFSATMNIFISNNIYRVLPSRQQATFIATDTFLANGAAFVGPMLGAALSEGLGILWAFYIIAALRGITALLFWIFKVGSE